MKKTVGIVSIMLATVALLFAGESAAVIAKKTAARAVENDMKATVSISINDRAGKTQQTLTALWYTKNTSGVKRKRIEVTKSSSSSIAKGTTLLSIEGKGKGNSVWRYIPGSPLGASQLSETGKQKLFLTSGFTFDDLSTKQYADYTYTYLGTKKIDGANCAVIQYVPKKSANSGYKRLIMYIDTSIYYPRRVEAFKMGKTPFVTLHNKNIVKMKDVYVAKQMIIVKRRQSFIDLPPSQLITSKTVITVQSATLNTGLSASLFSPSSLEK